MNLKEYSKIVDETAIYPQEVKHFGVAYTLIGMFDEMNEYMEKIAEGNKHTKEEIDAERFDVIWYICAFCKEVGLDFPEIIKDGMLKEPPMENELETDINPFRLFGLVKKYYRDNKELDKEKVTSMLISFVSTILEGLSSKEVKEGLQANYDKLIDRRERNVVSGDGDNR